MGFNPFRILFPKKFLGIDVGNHSIKVVEISRWGGGRTLENYGELKSKALFKDQFSAFEKTTHLVSAFFVSRALRAILTEAKIRTKAAIFSVPDFSTFFTSFELPPMAEEEMPEAVRFAAHQHSPMPISETTLDWRLISGTPGDKVSALKILLIAVPNEVVREYQNIAQMAGLQLYALESEVFGIIRSSIKESESKKVICLVDIGATSTSVSVVDRNILKKSHSFDFAGNQLTQAISTSLDLSYGEAERVKAEQGLRPSDKNLASTLTILIEPLLTEIKKVSALFAQSDGREIEEVYLTGGTANLSGLKEHFSESLQKKVIVPNAFADFLYPPILSKTLEEMSPRFSTAIGMALGGLEER